MNCELRNPMEQAVYDDGLLLNFSLMIISAFMYYWLKLMVLKIPKT